MARLVSVILQRADESVPWGFRLQGGADYNQLLSVQRVSSNSLAAHYLQVGDVIIMVEGRDARNLCHFDACELIKAAGNKTELVVRKNSGNPLSDEALAQQEVLEEQFVMDKLKQKRRLQRSISRDSDRSTTLPSEHSLKNVSHTVYPDRTIFSPTKSMSSSPHREMLTSSQTSKKCEKCDSENHPCSCRDQRSQRPSQNINLPSGEHTNKRKLFKTQSLHSSRDEYVDQQFTQTTSQQTKYYLIDPSVPGLMEAMGYCHPSEEDAKRGKDDRYGSPHYRDQTPIDSSRCMESFKSTHIEQSSQTTATRQSFTSNIEKPTSVKSRPMLPKARILQRSVSIPENQNEDSKFHRPNQIFSPPLPSSARKISEANRGSSVPPPKREGPSAEPDEQNQRVSNPTDVDSYTKFNSDILSSRLQFWEAKAGTQPINARRNSLDCNRKEVKRVQPESPVTIESTPIGAGRRESCDLSDDPKQRQLQLLIKEKVRLEEMMMQAKRRQGEAEVTKISQAPLKDQKGSAKAPVPHSTSSNSSQENRLVENSLRKKQDELKLIEESRRRDEKILKMQERKYEEKVRTGSLKASDEKILSEKDIPDDTYIGLDNEYDNDIAQEQYANIMNTGQDTNILFEENAFSEPNIINRKQEESYSRSTGQNSQQYVLEPNPAFSSTKKEDWLQNARRIEMEQEKLQIYEMLKVDQQRINNEMNKNGNHKNFHQNEMEHSGHPEYSQEHVKYNHRGKGNDSQNRHERIKNGEERRSSKNETHAQQAEETLHLEKTRSRPVRVKSKRKPKLEKTNSVPIVQPVEQDEFALLELVTGNQDYQLNSTNPTEMTMELLRMHEEQKMKQQTKDEYQKHLEQKQKRNFGHEDNYSETGNEEPRELFIAEKFNEFPTNSQAELMRAQEISIRNLDRQLQNQMERKSRSKESTERKQSSPVGKGDQPSRESSCDREAFANLRPYASTGDLQNGHTRTRPITKFSPDPMEFGFKPIETPQAIYSRSTGNLTQGPTAFSIVHLAGAEAGVAAGKKAPKKPSSARQYGVYNSMENLHQVSSKPPLPTQAKSKSYMRHAASEETLRLLERPSSEPRRHTYTEGEQYIDFSSENLKNLESLDYSQLLNEYYSAYYEAYYQSFFRKQQADLKEGKMSTAGGPPPPPPPPPFQVPGAAGSAPKQIAEPTPVRSMPPPPAQGTVPAALAGAMMKDKKPFTYTPGGLDLSEIKSPRMQRRLQRNASLEGVKPSPLAQQSSSPGPTPAMPPSGMVQVLPMGGASMVPKPKEVHKPPPPACGPAPPPPPFGVSNNDQKIKPVENQQVTPQKEIEPVRRQDSSGNEPFTQQNQSGRPSRTDLMPDAVSEAAETSSPSYPDDLNSLHNRSEESMDVNTSSEMEQPPQSPSRWAPPMMQRNVGNEAVKPNQVPFERPIPVKHESAPPLSQHMQMNSYPDETYQQDMEAPQQPRWSNHLPSSSPPISPMAALNLGSSQQLHRQDSGNNDMNSFQKASPSPAANTFSPRNGPSQDIQSPMQKVSSPGSGLVDKPLPWMVGLQKEGTPPTELMKRAQAKQQTLNRQSSLPQQTTPEASAPWRHTRSNNSKEPYNTGIIPPPDVFSDQMSPQVQSNQNPNASPMWQQQSPVYQMPQGKERIIPIMMEEPAPSSPGFNIRPTLNRVPSSPGRSESVHAGSSMNTPPFGSAFMSYKPSGGRDEPHQHSPVVYVESGSENAPIQSKSFRVIQNAYCGNNDYEQESSNSPKTYSGANIPSRSFKVLQQMTDNALNGSRQEQGPSADKNSAHPSTSSCLSPPPPPPLPPTQGNLSFSSYSPTSSEISTGHKTDEPKRSWRNWREESERRYSPVSPSYRSVSVDPDAGHKSTPAFSNSPSRLMEIVEAETQAMAAKGQPISHIYEEAYVPSQLLHQLQNDNQVHLRPVSAQEDRPAFSNNNFMYDNKPTQAHVANFVRIPVNENRPSIDCGKSVSSDNTSSHEDMYESMGRTAASKQSVLEELTSKFDPSLHLKKPRAAPGRVFKQLQDQYDSIDDQDDSESFTSSDFRSPSRMRDIASPSMNVNSSENEEISHKTYAGGRVPGRTFRMLQENIDTHPSVLIARK